MKPALPTFKAATKGTAKTVLAATKGSLFFKLALTFFVVIVGVVAVVALRWRMKHGPIQILADYRTCNHCGKTLTTWERMIRIDGYCTAEHRQAEWRRIDSMQLPRLMEWERWRQSMLELHTRMNPPSERIQRRGAA